MSTLDPQQAIAKLEAELAHLRTLHNINADLEKPLPTIINSPALDLQLVEGQQIAFVNDRIDCVSGTIIECNSNGTYDILVYIPRRTRRVVFKPQEATYEVVTRVELVEERRNKVMYCDARTIFEKRTKQLAQPQGGIEGVSQREIDVYVPSDRTLEVPRFHDWHTSIVGRLFDPSIYVYKIACWRAEMEVDGQKFPPEYANFPSKKPYYTEFSKCFNRYFKEYHQGMGKGNSKWNSVQISAILKSTLGE